MSELVASVRGLAVRAGGRAVLDAVDLDVVAGEVLGLIGPNGGGKTTLLLTLAGLVKPAAGTVTIRGTPAGQVATAATGTVGLITATPGLYPLLSGWENLAFFGGLYGLAEAEVRTRVTPFAERLGLLPHLDRPVGQGSSGMQQKISLARALLMDPALLLLDEPTANLDPISAAQIHATVRELADRGHAVVWVTHDLHAAEAICDRVVLVSGRVVSTHTFDGPRAAPSPGPLATAWAAALGGAP